MNNVIRSFGLQSNEALVAKKSLTFDGTAGKGATGTITLFTVTGTVAMICFGVGTVNLVSAGGGTLALGVAASAATFVASQTATALTAGLLLAGAPAAVANYLTTKLVNSSNVIATVSTAAITGGAVDFYCLWRPISDGATVIAA